MCKVMSVGIDVIPPLLPLKLLIPKLVPRQSLEISWSDVGR